MTNLSAPSFCIPCITKAQCPHLHTSTEGGFHYSEGDVWDDLHEVCIDCGAKLPAASHPPTLLTSSIPY